MSEDCIYCKIVAGEIPSNKVYEDEHTFAFLDINPLAKGHTLVVPKRHRARLEELSSDEASAHLAVLPAIVSAVQQAADAQGATAAWNNGRAAGQEVGHVHLHIVPRFDGDDAGPIHALFRKRPDLSESELEQLADQVREQLA